MNSIIVYFTQSGNTEKLAKILHGEVGGAIQTISADADFTAYDTIFVGTPNWAAGAPDPIKDYLKKYDFSGKTVVPFCTHGMGGLQNVAADIEALCTGATVLKAFAIKGENAEQAGEAVAAWLSELGLK